MEEGGTKMDQRLIDPVELEQDRQQRIEQMDAEQGTGWREQFRPGTFGSHELLDRTALLAANVEEFLLSHPACIQNKAWFTLAGQAVAVLQELYQQVGREEGRG
jgi:hypothetical protein